MRVLFVCTANVCRSRTAVEVFSVLAWTMRGPDRPRHEARSAGTRPDPGGRAVTRADLEWADVVCVMEAAHADHIRERFPLHGSKVRVLDIPDVYQPGDAALRDLLSAHILGLLSEAAPPRRA
jgi:predicted protein tyrosine phosphatase